MKASEVAALWFVIQAGWPRQVSPLSDDQARIVARLMHDVPLDAAIAAVEARSRRGATFPPNPGELVSDVREALAPTLSWADALLVLRRACSKFGPENAPAAIAWLQEESPVVAGWVEEYGWYRFSMSPIDNAVHGHRTMDRLAASFDEHAARSTAVPAIRAAALGANTAPPARQIGSAE